MEEFTMIDYEAMDMSYLLGQVRSDKVLSQEELLSILTQKVSVQSNESISNQFSNSNEWNETEAGGHTVTPDAVKVTPTAVTTAPTPPRTLCEGFKMKNIWLSKDRMIALKVGDRVDVRDKYGKYIGAEIVEQSRNKWKIHFISWSTAWDEWITISDRKRIASFGQISQRKICKQQLCGLSVDDQVMVKLPTFHKHGECGWMVGTVIEMDGGQLNVQYRVNHEGRGAEESQSENVHEYWVHADNLDECR